MALENSPLSYGGQIEGSSAPIEDNTLKSELRNQVFKNELIRDMIFDYVFTSNKDIRTCRLVDRSWLDYVTCRLQNASACPQIYEVSFEDWGMSKEFQDKKSKKYQVQQFLDTWASFPGAGNRIPLLSVEFTRPSNVTIKIEEVQDLITCLVWCGKGLSSLTLNLESSFHNGLKHVLLDLVADLAQLDLPNLKSLQIPLHKTDTLLVTRHTYFSCRNATPCMAMENSPLTLSGQPKDSSAPIEGNTLMPELRDEVFKNELIRNQIFDYVFSSNKDILTCRLIDRSWLDYATCRLQKASEVYEISFENWGMSKEFQDKKPKKYQVEQFMETWTSFPGAGCRVPLFSVDFTRPSNVTIKIEEVQDLMTCLMRCGNALNSLTLNLESSFHNGLKHAVNNLDFVADLAQLELPNLEALDIDLHQTNTLLVTRLLPPILLGCKQLTFLRLGLEYPNQLPLSRLVPEAERDEKIEYLPDTLEKIEFYVLMTSELLSNLLLKNSLPNLTELELNIERRTDSTSIVSRILHQFSGQLKSFDVSDNSDEPANESTFIKFPVMARLKKMSVTRFQSILEPGMEQPFPVLETLNLEEQSGIMMRKWTQNFDFDCVQDLTVVISDLSEFINDDFTLELSQQLQVTFPHLLELHLHVWGWVEDGSVQNIFKQLTQLSTLRIELENTKEIIGASTWDAILLGVSPEYARNLAESPRELWDSVNLSHIRSHSRSIVNLANLTTFLLKSNEKEMDKLLISDVSFHFAFLRMPNLHELTLGHGFRASKEMVDEWKRLGRKLYGHERDNGEDIDSSVSEDEEDV